MWRISALVVAFSLTGVATESFAESPAGSLISSAGWVRFQLVFGRIEAAPQKGRVRKRVESEDSDRFVRQSHAVDIAGPHVAVDYSIESPHQSAQAKYSPDGSFHLLYERCDEELKRVQLRQGPKRGVEVAVKHRGVTTKCRAADLWSLSLAEPQLFDTHVAPSLRLICPSLRADDLRVRVVNELFRLANDDRPCRQRVTTLVEQLGADHFRTRQRAEQRLKQLGPGVLPLLSELPRRRLDAEQRRRIESIQRHFRIPAPDCCERVAAWLASNDRTWLCLLHDAELSRRELAFAALCRNCGVGTQALKFRPEAPSATRRAQIDKLTSQLAEN